MPSWVSDRSFLSGPFKKDKGKQQIATGELKRRITQKVKEKEGKKYAYSKTCLQLQPASSRLFPDFRAIRIQSGHLNDGKGENETISLSSLTLLSISMSSDCFVTI